VSITSLSEPECENSTDEKKSCPVFGVESGGPIIGLGLLIIFFGIVSLMSGPVQAFPLPLSLIFFGFGVFLVWLGFKK
jgi:hypothetical protein